MADMIFVPLREWITVDEWPFFGLMPDTLQEIFVSLPTPDLNTGDMTAGLLLSGNIELRVPGLDFLSIAITGNMGSSSIRLSLEMSPFSLQVLGASVTLRVDADVLRPVKPGANPDTWEPDPEAKTLDIVLGMINLEINSDSNINLNLRGVKPFIPRCMVGQTGIMLQIGKLQWLTPTTPISDLPVLPTVVPQGFTGLFLDDVEVTIPQLPQPVSKLRMDNVFLGTGGFTGKVIVEDTIGTLAWNATQTPAKYTGGVAAGSLFGFPCGLKKVEIEIVQSCLQKSSILGEIFVPYLDKRIGVDLKLSMTGDLRVGFARPQAQNPQEAAELRGDGLLYLKVKNVAEVTLDSFTFEKITERVEVRVSGKLHPIVANLEWPEFDIKSLSFDSDGKVKVEGGWLNLRNQKSMNFHGFQIEITKFGFGKTEDGGKWIGFSGGVKLVEALPAGASVEGLRIVWYDDGSQPPRVTFNGIGVEFQVPNVLEFKGAISYREPYTVPIENGSESIERIDGAIRLKLISLDLEVDGKLVVGHASSKGVRPDYNFFAIYLGVELPAGIPLFSTGLGLYGFAGLFATQMEPNRKDDEGWYDNPDGTLGWYKRPEVGITDLAKKWDPQLGSLALGIGTTIGTLSDNGQAFHGKFLLVIVFPGPILMLEGRGDLLKKRTKQEGGKITKEPLFRAIAVLDGRQGTFTIGLDAQYKYKEKGELIDIRGSTETFFHFHDASAWHIYVGRDIPDSLRIRALLFKIFTANAYFMLQGKNPLLKHGAWIGYTLQKTYGSASVDLKAFMKGDAILSRKPTHFHGSLALNGSLKVAVFGVGFELCTEATCTAEIPEPSLIRLDLEVEVKLPWPLPSFEADFTKQWGPELLPPPLPLPLKEVAIEHLKVTTSWPLRQDVALLPNYESSDDFLTDNGTFNGPLEPSGFPSSLERIPVIPLDAMPHLTFARHVNDDALVGVNHQPGDGVWETIGDPSQATSPVKVRFGLKSITLKRYSNSGWNVAVASAPSTDPKKKLFGSWAPVPSMTGNGTEIDQTKLWLWSKNPFDFTRHSGYAWDEWFTEQFPDYPCIPAAPDRKICVDVAGIDPSDYSGGTWTSPDVPGLTITWNTLDGEIDPSKYTVTLPAGTKAATITPVGNHAEEIRRCVDFRTYAAGKGSNPRVEFRMSFEIREGVSPILAPQSLIDTVSGQAALSCANELTIALPIPSSAVQLLVTNGGSGFVEVFCIDSTDVYPLPSGQFQPILIKGLLISKLVIRSNGETWLHEVCYQFTQLTVTGTNTNGELIMPSSKDTEIVFANTSRIASVQVYITDEPGDDRDDERLSSIDAGIEKICVALPPDPAEVQRREEMVKHLRNELARWSQEAPVLEPHSIYRLEIVTTVEAQSNQELRTYTPLGDGTSKWGPKEQIHYAYFRTDGAPGLATLSTPDGFPDNMEFDSGLNDINYYVRQTIPATVPPKGQPPLLPRPVYRAYDVGVEFNESYVDLLYRIARRDLGLYLYNSNNAPVRDAQGRLVLVTNRWGQQEELTLTESEQRFLTTVNQSSCAKIDEQSIPRSKTLISSDDAQVLDADTVYEARLVPLLLHEDFEIYTVGTKITGPNGKLGDWIIADEGTVNKPSCWKVIEDTTASRFIAQISTISSGNTDRKDPNKPGTILLRGNDPALAANHTDQAGNWSDYRVNVFMRATTSGGAMGLVFRYKDGNTYYRFSMDRDHRYRRLIRTVDSVMTILAEDDFVYRQNTDYLITIEAVGDSLRIYQDGTLVFDVADTAITSGRIGLYCSGNAGVRYSDVRVDDFRAKEPKTPAVYRFMFTSSRFANFFHHLHSYQDETWRQLLPPATDLTPFLAEAIAVDFPAFQKPVSESETRAFESLALQVLGSKAYQTPKDIEITRIVQNDQTIAFILLSPEPIDWARTKLEVLRASRRLPAPQQPDFVKLTNVSWGNAAFVTLLLREATTLTGYRIEQQLMPGPLSEQGGPPLLIEDFSGEASGVLFFEEFGPNALDQYTLIHEAPPGSAIPKWLVINGRIEQHVDYRGGQSADDSWKRPGAMAVLRSGDWRNARITVKLSTNSQRDIGIVFRYQDENNYYRLSFVRFDAERNSSIRRLVKKVNGIVTLLWEDDVLQDTLKPSIVMVETFDDRIIGYADHRFLFGILDPDLDRGTAGFYCWGNSQAFFEGFQIESLETDPILWQPLFTDLDEWVVVDEEQTINRPSLWKGVDGIGIQTSSIGGQGGGWEVLPGAAVDIGVGVNGSVWIIGADPVPGGFSVYHWTDSQWEPVDGGAVRIAVGADGVPWVVNDRQEVLQRSGGNWTLLPGGAMDIGIGPDGTPTYAISTVAATGGHEVYYWDGESWIRFPGAGSRIAIGPEGNIYLVNDSQQIFVFHWISGQWEQIPGSARDIGVGADGSVWIVGIDPVPGGYRVSRWNGLTWQEEPGTGAVGIAVSPEGNPWVVTDKKQIMWWAGDIRAKPGTYLLGGSSTWGDVEISVKARSDGNGAIGIAFRYLDGDNYLRFSMDRQDNYRRLVKKVGGKFTTLWEDQHQYSIGQFYDLTIVALGGWISLYIDGMTLVRVYDDGLRNGKIGLYAHANDNAQFSHLIVRDPARKVGRWLIYDDTNDGGPSRWRIANGEISQAAPIGSADPIAELGTYAIAGETSWRNYELRACLRSDTENPIGLVFRYVNEGNYYKFAIDSQHNIYRLTKVANRILTILWEAPGSVTSGESFTVSIQAAGNRLLGYRDGEELFDLTDETHSTGRIGLYCATNPTAKFEWLEIHPPPLRMAALFRDRFTVGDLSDWQFVDDQETVYGPSSWELADGILRQTSKIQSRKSRRRLRGRSRTGLLNVSVERGTQAVVTKGDWSDIVLRVKVQSQSGGTIGVLFRYTDEGDYYRFTMNSQVGHRQFIKQFGTDVTVLWEDNSPYDRKQEYEITIAAIGDTFRGFLNGIPMFVVADADLMNGGIGLFCSGNPDAKFSQVNVYPLSCLSDAWLLEDKFNFVVPNRWTYVDDGSQNGPSQWGISQSELRQTSLISDGTIDADELIKSGTCALAGDVAWSDYRLSVRLRSSGGGAIGIVFRHQDSNHYYRFSMDRSRRYRRLIKNIGGTVSVLWQDSELFSEQRDYVLTIDCEHDQLTGYIDGITLFQVRDHQLLTGRVGLYCWSNNSACFSEIRVAPPAWTSLYTFGKEPRLPAGTQVRVYAPGGKQDYIEEGPGVVARFAEASGDSATRLLSLEGVRLRVIDSTREIRQERYFILDTEYVPVNIVVLRKADGTAMVIAPTSGVSTIFSDGEYKFRFIYSKSLAGLPVLSQSGNTSTEIVAIDVPWATTN